MAVKRQGCVAGVLLLCAGGSVALAGEPVPIMDEVVVSATKTRETRKDIVNPVITMDALDIEESPATGVGELLANEPGVDWRTYGDYAGASQYLQIRGMGPDETQVLLNGVPLNSPSLGSADLGRIPLNNIGQIEVVKGSGSLLYGSGAMAGTVNISTKNPQRDKPTIKASSGYGNNDTYAVSAEQGMYAIGDLGYYLTANHMGSEGERANSGLDHEDASLKLLFDKGDVLTTSLYGQYVKRDFGTPGIVPPAGTASYRNSRGVELYNGEVASLLNHGADEDALFVFDIDSSPVQWLRLNLQADYTDLESYNYQRYSYSDGAGLKSWVANDVRGLEGNVELKPFTETSLLVGSDYHDHQWRSRSTNLNAGGSDTTTTGNEAEIHSRGAFMEAQVRPVKMVKAIGGIRQESHSTFGSINLPHYGLVVNPDEHTAIKFNNGKHFKAPTPNDLFWPDDGWARGNPNLAPQAGWHTDLTAERAVLDEKVFLTASYFEWNIKGKIIWAPNPAFANKWTPTNANSSDGQGFELGARYTPAPRLTCDVGYTYTEAYDTLAAGVRHAQHLARNRAKANAVYRWDSGLTASGTLRYVGDRESYRASTDMDPTDILEAYMTTDVKIEQQLMEHYRLTLDISNLFDVQYDTYAADYYDSNWTRQWGRFPGSGVNVFLGVTVEY